jgi:hypothetical protein
LADNKTVDENPSSILSSLQTKCDILQNSYPTNGHYQLKDLDKSPQFHLGNELSDRYQDRNLSSGNVVEYETLINDYYACLRTVDGKMLKGDIELLSMLANNGTLKADMILGYMQKYPDTPYVDYLNDQYAIDKINKLDKNSSRSAIKSVRNLPMSKEVSELARKRAKAIALEKRNGYHIVTVGAHGIGQMGALILGNYDGVPLGVGLGGGVALDIRFTNVIGIRAEGEYIYKNYKEEKQILNYSAWTKGSRNVTLSSINIPVMLTINPNSKVVWDLGVQYGLCQGGRRFDGIDNSFEGWEEMSSNEYNDRQLSVIGGFRAQQGFVYLGLRAEYGLDNVLNKDFKIAPWVTEGSNSHCLNVKGFLGFQF